MRSLRQRLTISYLVLVAGVLVIVALVTSFFVAQFLARGSVADLDQAVPQVRELLHQHGGRSPAEITAILNRAVLPPHIHVVLSFGARPKALGPPPQPPLPLVFFDALGLRPRFVHAGAVTAFVTSDLVQFRDALRIYFAALGFCCVSALIMAYFSAAWIAEQAIAPLLTVTKQLSHFAGGDFTPRPITIREGGELGALVVAYNGAVAQVAAAFAERMLVEEQMQRFIADAGHELRTPLTVVIGYLSVLERGGLADPPIRDKALRTMNTEVQRMRRLVERLMSLAKLERPEPPEIAPIDLAELCVRVAHDLQPLSPTPITVTGRGTALADAADVHEALVNLVENSLKYGAGTPVEITIIKHGVSLELRVCDGGPGIPIEQRSRIFERFYRGEEQRDAPGSGLGLAIVSRAVVRNAGTLTLEAAEPGRTVFLMTLPAL